MKLKELSFAKVTWDKNGKPAGFRAKITLNYSGSLGEVFHEDSCGNVIWCDGTEVRHRFRVRHSRRKRVMKKRVNELCHTVHAALLHYADNPPSMNEVRMMCARGLAEGHYSYEADVE